MSALGGIAAIIWSFSKEEPWLRKLIRCGGLFLITFGLLMQGGAAPWFFALLAFMILVLDEGGSADLSGTVRYRDEFDQAM